MKLSYTRSDYKFISEPELYPSDECISSNIRGQNNVNNQNNVMSPYASPICSPTSVKSNDTHYVTLNKSHTPSEANEESHNDIFNCNDYKYSRSRYGRIIKPPRRINL